MTSSIDLETAMQDFVADIRSSTSSEELVGAAARSFERIGLDGFAISDEMASAEQSLTAPLLRRWRPGAHEAYVDGRFWEKDYILACNAQSSVATGWRGDIVIGDPAYDRFLDYCGYYGGRSGIVGHLLTSRGGHRIVSATSSETRNWGRAEIATVLTLANLIVLRERQIRNGPKERPFGDDLTPIQLEVLQWASQGKSNTDIATILAISPRMVAYHFSRILERLGVASRAQAIAAMVSRQHVDS